MCGIVGYTGKRQAAPILLHGLYKLEYRGYDSAGLAVRKGVQPVEIVKAKGKVRALSEKTQDGATLKGECGIGHTRWATHGAPSENNAHPHRSDDGSVVLVHNGIIENYAEIKRELSEKGYSFYSQTDTEVAAKLLHYCIYSCGNPIEALLRFMKRVRGSYAIAALLQDYPEEIFALRKESPLIVGVADGESYLASDAPAILEYTRSVYYMNNLEIARLKKGEVAFYDREGKRVEKELTKITWSAEAAEKDGFQHFMLKEIFEQPAAVENTLKSAIENGKINLSKIGLTEEELQKIEEICIVACGSAYHAGVVMQYAIEDLAKLPVRVELASEFRYRNAPLRENTLVVVISQSGETADSLAALREAKSRGVKTLAIVNVVGSSIAREADYVFYTLAGPEIAVATTKAYSAQLIAGYLLAVALARTRGTFNQEAEEGVIAELLTLPEKIKRILAEKERIKGFAERLAGAKAVFFIGRGVDYAIGLEGSLKLKEISYIHSEAYAAGELKHGAISLVEEGVWAVSVLTQGRLIEKTLSNMTEVKSRGGKLFAVTTEEIEGADEIFRIPKTDERFAPSLAVLPLQVLSYYVSVFKGLDVDKPRNLAKSVTVE